MSLKLELETWANALKSYDEDDLEGALDQFSAIAETSKIFTNIGLIHATLGEHEIAVEQFKAAVELDQYLAVAYFQSGVSNFLLGRYELALEDFDKALLYLRGNQNIDYEQLGLKFKLFSAEVLFNKGLSLIYMGRIQEGMLELNDAKAEKVTEEHGVIDEAIADQGEGYTVFSIPVGVLYRPSEAKLKNAKTKDYMGKAKLVAAADSGDAFTTFTGVTRMRQGVTPGNTTFIDNGGAGAGLSRSMTAPAPRKTEPLANLARSKTTLNVPTDARERIAGLTPGGPAASAPASPAPKMARSNTSIGAGSGGMGGPVRGLSVGGQRPTKPAASSSPPPVQQPKAEPPRPKSTAPSEFYDDYLDAYHDDAEDRPPLPTGNPGNQRIAAWAQKTQGAPPASAPVGRSASSRPPPSTYAASSYGGRKKSTRRAPSQRGAPSQYGGDEEDFQSDEEYELVKIRVKLHYQDDIRGMALNPDVPFEEFLEMVSGKFGLTINDLGMKFTDEDGGKVSLRDESDYDMAIETARQSANGKAEGKLEIWCVDI